MRECRRFWISILSSVEEGTVGSICAVIKPLHCLSEMVWYKKSKSLQFLRPDSHVLQRFTVLRSTIQSPNTPSSTHHSFGQMCSLRLYSMTVYLWEEFLQNLRNVGRDRRWLRHVWKACGEVSSQEDTRLFTVYLTVSGDWIIQSTDGMWSCSIHFFSGWAVGLISCFGRHWPRYAILIWA